MVLNPSQPTASPSGRPAGPFGAWLAQMRGVLRGERDADVPCDGCVGCCVSAYQIPLRPDDTVALDRVPAARLSLPGDGGLARMLPGEDGTCPMLSAGRCEIYAGRPRTCRDYDCRIYAAAGLQPDGQRPAIQQRVSEWAFTFEDDRARLQARAVRRAAGFILAHSPLFPPRVRAHSATAAAVLAIKVHERFITPRPETPAALVREVLAAVRVFDAA